MSAYLLITSVRPCSQKITSTSASEYPFAGMFSYFWSFYTSYIRGLTQTQVMAKFKTKAVTNGLPGSSEKSSRKRPRIVWMDGSDDESHLKTLSSKLDAQHLSSPRPAKRSKISNVNGVGPSGSKQAAVQEQRKALPIAQGESVALACRGLTPTYTHCRQRCYHSRDSRKRCHSHCWRDWFRENYT